VVGGLQCAAGATPPTTFFLGRRFVASMGLVFWHFLDMFWFAVVGVPLFFLVRFFHLGTRGVFF